MKSYLDLVTQYNRVHRKKNTVIIACIAVAVCLVVAIFGMADIGIKFEMEQLKKDYGSYHINVKDINTDQAARIRNRVDVAQAGFVEIVSSVKYPVKYQDKQLQILGGDEAAMKSCGLLVSKGHYPSNINEVMVDKQAVQKYGWSIGDNIKLDLGKLGQKEYIIVGVFNDFAGLKVKDSHGIVLSFKGIQAIAPNEWTRYYVQFKDHVKISKAIKEIKNITGIHESQITRNTYLLTVMGEGGSSLATQMYSIAFVLFTLVLLAGCIMISNSFSMNVLERVKFFGLMRCLGASKKQVKRYVMRDGLQLSLKGIPIGLLVGSIMIEVAVIILRILNPDIFGELRIFQVSVVGIIAGICVGFLTVILASLNPAKKASKISPLSAILGNLNEKENMNKKAVSTKGLPIDISMGIHHAVVNKKSFILMISSFAISIVLFLGFSVFIDFSYNASTPSKPSTPDISICDPELTLLIPQNKVDDIQKMNGVKHAYGRSIETLSASSNDSQKGSVFIVSHDNLQFGWEKDNLISGKIDIDLLNGGQNILVDKESGLSVGDKITLHTDKGDVTSKVGGVLSKIPFDTKDKVFSKVIVSHKYFTKLTGKKDYSILEVQLEKNAPENTVNALRQNFSSKMTIRDSRQRNQESRNTFYTMVIFIYGFTGIIAVITLFNIVNSMNISVASRKRYYGMMRAVGISVKQLKRMVLSEALTYSVCGCIIGCILGTILHRILYVKLVTSYFDKLWVIPGTMLIVIILFVIAITILSVIGPMKKIGELDIVDVVNAQ